MSFFLDTNTCIYALKGSYPAIETRVHDLRPSEIKIPSIVQAELLFGAEKSQRRRRTLGAIEAFLAPYEIVPFDQVAARQYASIRKTLESQGEPIGPNDLIVAATVAAHAGVLVTHNIREFQKVTAIQIEDWAI